MVLTGCIWLGLSIAVSMKRRLDELREIERIVNHIEGEICYNNALMKEALSRTARRCGQPFSAWFDKLCGELEENYNDTFCDIWDRSVKDLQKRTHLTKEDVKELILVGQTLGYPDIKSMETGLKLQKENIHNKILALDGVLANNMKVSVILGTLGGIFLVVILI